MELELEKFLQQAKSYSIIDVRTPAEFDKGHIPSAYNIPLFSDEKRAIVGTIYKQKSKELAIEKGLEFVGPKLLSYVKEAKKLAKNNKVLIHCWRGGMRSKSMAWLFNTSGLEADTLIGGYKAFQKATKNYYSNQLILRVIGGKTGSGKTDVIKALENIDEQTIDLEGIANHKGSAFGHIGENKQPTNEQFANNLYYAFRKFNTNKIIWLEDESRSIGKVWLPDQLYAKIREAKTIVLESSEEERVQRLVKDYTNNIEENKAQLKKSVLKIEKRLGGLRTQNSIKAIDDGLFHKAAAEILAYYDKTYSYGLSQRDKKTLLKFDRNKKNAEIVAFEIKNLKF